MASYKSIGSRVLSTLTKSIVCIYVLVTSFYLLINLIIITIPFRMAMTADGSPSMPLKWEEYGCHHLNNLIGSSILRLDSGIFLLEIPIDIAFIAGCLLAITKHINKKWIYLCTFMLIWYVFSIHYLYFDKDFQSKETVVMGYFLTVLLIPGFILNLKYAGVLRLRSKEGSS